jgi:hypothetical protein
MDRMAPDSRKRRMGRATALLLAGGLAALCLAACAARSLPPGFAPPADARTIPGVPAHEQRTQQCGPAALASVLNHYGSALTPDDIARDIYRPAQLGTLNLDMALYPRGFGFRTRWFDGSLDDLVEAVRSGRPLIVMVDRGMAPLELDHFLVVTGYDPDGLVVLAGGDGPEHRSWAGLDGQWRKTGRWTLEILPAGDGTPDGTGNDTGEGR